MLKGMQMNNIRAGITMIKGLQLDDFPSVRIDPSKDAVRSLMLTRPVESTGNVCQI